MPNKSMVEALICSEEFSYLQPYFYNYPYALRCELGIGDTDESYLDNARKRALAIYHMLFPNGADAILFNYWIYDYSDSGDAECHYYDTHEDMEEMVRCRIEYESEQLRFLSYFQFKYRHMCIENLETYASPEDTDYSKQHRNRIVCFSDGIGFDYTTLINQQINDTNSHDVSFVSFENECIFSIYDDRGCDIVFATQEKMKAFYEKLQPYFLPYDIEEMRKRYNG